MTSRAAHWRAESVVSQESQSSPLVQQNGIVPRRFTWVEVWREMPEALHYERMHCLAENFFVETGAGWRRILSRKLEGADTDLCLREGYDVTAAALRDCSRALELNDKVLRGSIPKWILDHYGEELLAAVPPDQRHEYLMNRVMGRIAWWQAEELQKGSKYKSEYKGQCTLYERWEAKQELGRINDGPHESIPESFVRAHLALQFDIKPAEVTWKQILVEVERLSFRSKYPAVELVPTAPATAGDHGPWFFYRLHANMCKLCLVYLPATLALMHEEGGPPLKELDAAYRDHLMAYLARDSETDDSLLFKELEAIEILGRHLSLNSIVAGKYSRHRKLDAADRDHILAFLTRESSPTVRSPLRDAAGRDNILGGLALYLVTYHPHATYREMDDADYDHFEAFLEETCSPTGASLPLLDAEFRNRLWAWIAAYPLGDIVEGTPEGLDGEGDGSTPDAAHNEAASSRTAPVIEAGPQTLEAGHNVLAEPELVPTADRLSEYSLDPCHQPIEGRKKTPGGRPKALLAVDGKKIQTLRGDASQKAFCRLLRKVSTDVLQKAERGSATEKTLIKICKYAAKKSQNLTLEELIINVTPTSRGNQF